MDKEIKDYLHLYLGCRVYTGTGYVTLLAIQKEIIPMNYRVIVLNGNVAHETAWSSKHKLCLRPLSDMTEEEKNDLRKIDNNYNQGMKNMLPEVTMGRVLQLHMNTATPFNIQYLLSKQFDLFGLIDSDLAIDKTKI